MNPVDTDFYRGFASRVRAQVAAIPAAVEHGRTADEATTHRSVDAYLTREYPNLFPTEETPAPRREWTITTEFGVTVHGYHPTWDQTDPSAHNIPADRLEMYVSDVDHVQHWKGQVVTANLHAHEGRYTGECPILCPQMNLRPFDPNPAERVPNVSIELAEGSDEWIEHLDPQGVADVASRLRAQADRLENEVLPALIAAREDWAKNGAPR